MLYERMLKAKKNLGLEEKLLTEPDKINVAKEEVVIGQDYIDECDYLDHRNRVEDLLEAVKIPEATSPNDLDADVDEEEDEISDEEMEEEVKSELTELSAYAEALSPTIEEKEESMDAAHPEEDTSGNTESKVMDFFEKYPGDNDLFKVLRKDLMAVLADIQWIKASNYDNEQWALDFADALNELSVSI